MMARESCYMDGYRCIACGGRQLLDFDGFLCPACGDNLEITYDYRAAARELDGGFGSVARDIFRYGALLPLRRSLSLPLRIGGTPLYPVPRLGRAAGLRNLYLKDESGNPSASLKDRASAIALGRAIETGVQTIATASTGNAGSSIACLAAATGMQAVVFVPASAPAAKLTQLLSYGARVLAVNGTYDDAYDLCLAACVEFGWFNRSTGFNPFTREGKKTCAFEIWEDLGGTVPDRIVVPTGDGNIISAVWKGWRELQSVGLIDHLPRIDCAQSVSSSAVSDTVQRLQSRTQPVSNWSDIPMEPVKAATIADSIAVDRPRDGVAAVRAVIESGGRAVTVPDKQIIDALGEIARLTGVFPEPAAATPWAAVRKMVDHEWLNPDETVVCLVTGNGLKDTAGSKRACAEPTVIEPSIAAVKSALS